MPVKKFSMVQNFFRKSWKYLVVLFIGFSIGIIVDLPSCSKQPESHVEYVQVHDTVFVTQEVIKEKTKIRYIDRIDTVYVTEKGDTVYVKDIPIDYKEYVDTIATDYTKTTLKVNFHGYNSDIDSVRVNHSYLRKDELIVKQPKKFGWDITVGPYFGYGINATPTNPMQVNHGFEFGVGVVIGPSWRIK